MQFYLDVSLQFHLLHNQIESATLVKEIEAHGGDILQNAQVFDVYEGEHVAEDEKSIAIRLSYLDVEQVKISSCTAFTLSSVNVCSTSKYDNLIAIDFSSSATCSPS